MDAAAYVPEGDVGLGIGHEVYISEVGLRQRQVQRLR